MRVVTSAARADLETQANEAFRQRWPEFVFHGEAGPRYLPRVREYFGEFDVMLLDGEDVAAGGWGVLFDWSGEFADLPDGYDGALARAAADHEAGRKPTALSFMAAAVAPDHDGKGLAARVLEALTERAREHGVERVVAPLRPTWKHRYPLQPMAEYATWKRGDGLSIDPWIRTHQRMGATVLGPADRSMVVTGSVADWESWTGMVFPASGQYVIPEGLNTLAVDREADQATYVEENLWVRHR